MLLPLQNQVMMLLEQKDLVSHRKPPIARTGAVHIINNKDSDMNMELVAISILTSRSMRTDGQLSRGMEAQEADTILWTHRIKVRTRYNE